METIILKLDAEKMKNPDLEIRYILPARVEEYTDHIITDNGYDYISNTELGLWFATEDAKESVALLIQLLGTEIFLDNDLSETVEIYISTQECAEIEMSKKVFPIQQ